MAQKTPYLGQPLTKKPAPVELKVSTSQYDAETTEWLGCESRPRRGVTISAYWVPTVAKHALKQNKKYKRTPEYRNLKEAFEKVTKFVKAHKHEKDKLKKVKSKVNSLKERLLAIPRLEAEKEIKSEFKSLAKRMFALGDFLTKHEIVIDKTDISSIAAFERSGYPEKYFEGFQGSNPYDQIREDLFDWSRKLKASNLIVASSVIGAHLNVLERVCEKRLNKCQREYEAEIAPLRNLIDQHVVPKALRK